MKKFIFFILLNLPLIFCLLILFNIINTPNPIDFILSITGHSAMVLFLFLLAFPIFQTYLNLNFYTSRRIIGLYIFLYCLLHTLTYVGLDYQFEWNFLLIEVLSHTYLQLGLYAFLLLIPMALSSNDFSKKLLASWWFQLHKLLYLVITLSFLHYYFLIKLDFYFFWIYLFILLLILCIKKRPNWTFF